MLELYAHPFSSYCQKALIALYENGTQFEFRMLDGEHPENGARLMELSPPGKFPVLVDDGVAVAEATIIVEHLDLHYRGATRFLPDDPVQALAVRALDRFIDLYPHDAMQKIVKAHIDDRNNPDARVIAAAKATLDMAYAVLEARLDGDWLAGDFGLADCAAAPALYLRRLGAPDSRSQAACLSRPAQRATFLRAARSTRHGRSAISSRRVRPTATDYYWRCSLASALSSACRKRDRSALANGSGPPSCSPPARRSAMIARVAMAPPIELAVNGLPVGADAPSRLPSGSGRRAGCRRLSPRPPASPPRRSSRRPHRSRRSPLRARPADGRERGYAGC